MYALITIWHSLFTKKPARHSYYGHSEAELVAFNRRLFRLV